MLNLLLTLIRVHYAKSRMVAYVNGELSPAARRRIGRYIDLYPVVYAAYLKQREIARELNWRVPLIGYPEKPTLDRMWSAIQTELNLSGTDTPPSPQPQRYLLGTLRLRYGVMGLALAFVFLLPLTLNGNHSAFAHSLSQPAPQTLEIQPTDTISAKSGQAVGMLVETRTQVKRKLEVTPPAPALPQATPVSTED